MATDTLTTVNHLLDGYTATVMHVAGQVDDHRDRLIVLRDAMTRLEGEREMLRAEQRRAVLAAVEAGITNESELGRLVGVNRLTIRAWLGKSV